MPQFVLKIRKLLKMAKCVHPGWNRLDGEPNYRCMVCDKAWDGVGAGPGGQ